jgi:hypothetical protein
MRLIDADELKKLILSERDKIPLTVPAAYYELVKEKPNAHGNAMRGGIRVALRCMEQTPTIDAVPVVRCKDCVEYIPWLDGKICARIGSYFGNTKPNDFCSHGTRRSDNDTP